jgi:type I restriction enzyme S subunit
MNINNVKEKYITHFIVPLPPLAEQQRIVEKIEQTFSILDNIDALQSQYADNLTVLKTKLIDAAIQGKLTAQLPEDGTAEDLYRQIQSQKQTLIQAGKLKKEKPLAIITADEIPFEIPKNWKWVRLASICSIINGDRGKNYPAKSTLKHEGIPFISALNLNGVSVTQDEHLLCLDNRQYELLGNGKLQKDDIVICIRGSLGKHGRYPFDKGAIASSLVICRLPYSKEIMGDYVMIWLDSSAFPAEIKRYDSGTAQPNLAANSLEQFLIPLPPLAEQKRIAAKLEELLLLCMRTSCSGRI